MFLEYVNKKLVFIKEFSSVIKATLGSGEFAGCAGGGVRGATTVFGLDERRSSTVCRRVVKQVNVNVLRGIIGYVALHRSTIYTDGFRAYSQLKTGGCFSHEAVERGNNEFVRKEAHVNGIENFWGIAKISLVKRKDLKGHAFFLHLEECKFRFNHRNDNLYHLPLFFCRRSPLKLY